MTGSIQLALILLSLPTAWLWGQWPERWAAFVMVSLFAIHRYYHWLVPGIGVFTKVDYGHLTLDLYLLSGFFVIALLADRQWPIWAAAAQVVAVLGHFVRLISGDVAQLAYAIMTRAPSWLQISLIFGGIAFTVRRQRLRARRSARG